MARLPRVVVPGALHLVVHTGHGQRPVFAGAAARERYLGALREAAREAGVAVHAYGLPDHELRLLATPRDPLGLARLIQSTDRRYVRWLNREHATAGSPWAHRFRSAVVDAERHFVDCLRFVEGAGGASFGPETAPASWTSARHHLGLERNPLITEHPAFWSLGNTPFERELAYRRLAEEPVSERVAENLRVALRGWVVGDDAFAAEIERVSGRRTGRQPAGRPRVRRLRDPSETR